jgi:hypothetical protein
MKQELEKKTRPVFNKHQKTVEKAGGKMEHLVKF